MRLVLIVCLLLALAPASHAAAPARIALVIGNGAYRSVGTLRNPDNDARLMARTLRGLGFALVGGGAQLDLDRAGMEAAIRRFRDAIAPGSVAFFYYSGHGLQVGGANYLVPVSAAPESVRDVPTQMVAADLVLQDMADAGAALNVMVLDACRNDPFAALGAGGTRGIRPGGVPSANTSGDSGAGLAEMHAPAATIISFATQPGGVAFDGAAGAPDSPYTAALAQSLGAPGLDVVGAFNRAGVIVGHLTGAQQEPWLAISPLEQDFFLAGQAGAGASPLPAPMPEETAMAAPRAASMPAGRPAEGGLCPPAGLSAVRSDGEEVRYEGAAAGAPGICLATIAGRQAALARGIWPANWPGVPQAESALQRVLVGPLGTAASFMVNADVQGIRDTVTSEGWRFTLTNLGPARLVVGGTERPAQRVLWQERNLSNPYQAQAEITLDATTGAVLAQHFRVLVGGQAAAYDFWAAYGGGLASVPDFSVTALQ